jgi:hypothetical protein
MRAMCTSEPKRSYGSSWPGVLPVNGIVEKEFVKKSDQECDTSKCNPKKTSSDRGLSLSIPVQHHGKDYVRRVLIRYGLNQT